MHYRATVFPVNAVKVMRICCFLEGSDKLPRFGDEFPPMTVEKADPKDSGKTDPKK